MKTYAFVINSFKLHLLTGILVLLKLHVIAQQQTQIRVGAQNMEVYMPLLEHKKVGIVANQTSLVGNTHLVDTLKKLGIDIRTIFCPEHGFRGSVSAGEHIADDVDRGTGIPIKSLYGNHKKPAPEDLKNISIMVFDLQDVGARFYTYISTMHYVMQACAEQHIPLLILDRPNPNGFYVDGPVLQDSLTSFVGMHKVPVVHGMTIGEYARMINGEHWLGAALSCDITIIPCENYTHKSHYILPVNPSPNLPNQRAVLLYPTLCFFEGTVLSLGRGTSKPFQQYGHPLLLNSETSFVPKSIPGALNPPLVNQVCFGFDLSNANDIPDTVIGGIQIEVLIKAYQNFPNKDQFFNSFFKKLAGNTILQTQIMEGYTAQQIRESWKNDLITFKKTRKKYLLYDDFE